MTLQYNISGGQLARPRPARASAGWSLGGAVAASLGLHAIVATAIVLAFSGQGGQPAEESAAITVFVEPGTAPVASASEVAAAIAAPPDQELPPPTVPLLEDAVPMPEEASVPLEFKPPPAKQAPAPPETTTTPPPPKPAQAPPRPAQRKPPVASNNTGPTASGPPSAAAPSAQEAAPAPAASVAPGWNALIAAWLAAHKRYPEEARRRSERGEVTIRFSVAADGKVLDVSVVRGSGSSALDAAALAMLRGATVPPPGSAQTRDVRIRYSLTD